MFCYYAGYEGSFVAGNNDRWDEGVAQHVCAILVVDRQVSFVPRCVPRLAGFHFLNLVLGVRTYRRLVFRASVPFARFRVNSGGEHGSPAYLIAVRFSAYWFHAYQRAQRIYFRFHDRGTFVAAARVIRASANGGARPVIGLV